MALKPTSPEEHEFHFRKLRLWRDDLDVILSRIQQLPDVEIQLEADHHTLDDLANDLPKLGPRVEYFKITATKPGKDGSRREVLRLQLGGCDEIKTIATNPRLRLDRDQLHATDPDLETMAVLYEISEYTNGRRWRGLAKTATVLRTGTRSEAPTWWQQYRSHVWIGVATGAVF